jgi:threonine/homoserine/homoserine lactone efflux protein
MVETILKGITIGLLVSAPMGPIGVLCVQRTLNEGRMHGFVSGIGASLSDLVYAIIAGLGMGFIMDFIETNHYPLQIAGSLVLMILGYYIFKSNPAQKLLKQDQKKSPYWQNMVSSFFINLSNIGILFFFIAMFARFNFITPELASESVIGILSIGAGAVLWWFLISTLVNKIRAKFNPRGLKVFNNVLGIILICIAVVGTISGIYGWIELK